MNWDGDLSVVTPLARFCARTRFEDLPDDLVEDAKLKVLDALACGYAGCEHETAELALRLAKRLAPGSATVVFDPVRLAPLDAAFVNSAVIHGILQDDVDLESGHPACTVIPAALAMGETCRSSGAELIMAIVLGYEAMWRVGGCGAFLMRATARGFRGNTILGAFGSAAGSARLLRLDEQRTANALATTASFAAGLLEPLNRGTMERCFQQASNSRQGMMAALLAAEGIDACPTSVEGPTGLYAACADLKEFPRGAMDSLGREYRLPKAFAKPYPSAGSNTVGIAVAELLVGRHAVRAEDVAGVVVKVLPRFTGVPGYPSIAYKGPFTTVEQALISFPFQVACMLKNRAVDLRVIRRDLRDRAIARLATQIQLVGVDVPHPLWCAIEVEMTNGQRLGATSDEIDWRHFYLDREVAAGKFRRESAGRLERARADEVIERVYALERLPDVSELTALL